MFKELFVEFAGVLRNSYFDLEVGDEVEFIYKNEKIEAVITEIEDGKHAKAILMVMEPELYKNKKDLTRSFQIHVSQLKPEGSSNLKTIKELRYV